ncbi:hypothetical protein ACFL5V_09010 [Fibrobacterota bacterium]
MIRKSRATGLLLAGMFMALMAVSCSENGETTTILGDDPNVLAMSLSGELTGDVSSVAQVTATVTGDGLQDTTLVVALTWNLNSSIYTGIIAVPADGQAWLAEIRVIDAAGRVTGYQAVTLDNVSTGVISLTMDANNAVPQVSAGADTTLSVNDVVSLHGTATDLNGSIVTWEWDIGNTGVFVASSGDTSIALPATETAAFSAILRATDNEGNTGLDTVVFNVLQDIPLAFFTASPETVSVKDTIFLAGTASDSLGTIATWEWDAGGTGVFVTSTSGSSTAIAPDTGVAAYPIVLRVTDDDGNAVTVSDTIVVLQDAPVLQVLTEATEVSINDSIRLVANAQQAFGSVVLWEWDIGLTGTFVPTATGDTVVVAPDSINQIYNIALRATDDDGNAVADTVAVEISLDPPTSRPTAEMSTVSIGDTIRLLGDAVNQLDSIVVWSWDMGLTGTFVQTSTSDTFALAPDSAADSLGFALSVTDEDGFTDTAEVWVSVVLDIPVLRAMIPSAVSLNDSILLQDSTIDTLGSIVKREWDIGATGTFVEVSTNDTTVLAPDSAVDSLLLVLRVTDDDSNVVTDTLVMSVETDPPVAELTAPDTAQTGRAFTINGLSSSPGETHGGSIIRYEYSIGSYDTFIEASGEDTLITAPAAETDSFVVVLRVTDDDSVTDLDTQYVRIYGIWNASADFDGYDIALTTDNGVPWAAYRHGSPADTVAVVMLDSVWTAVSEVSVSGAYDIALAAAGGVPFVAVNYIDPADSISKLTVLSFNGTTWNTVGTAGFAQNVTDISLALDDAGQPAVAYSAVDSRQVSVMAFDGAAWADEGTQGFSSDSCFNITLAISASGAPFVSYIDASTGTPVPVVMELTGNNWSEAGGAGSLTGAAGDIAIFSANDTLYAAYWDATAANTRVLMLDGNSWAVMGQFAAGAGAPYDISLAVGAGRTYVSLSQDDPLNPIFIKANVMTFDGASWVTAGAPIFAGLEEEVSLAVDGSGVPYAAFLATVMVYE